jgi:hypothetical protein
MNKNVVLLVENCSFNFIYIHLIPRFQAWQWEQASKRAEQASEQEVYIPLQHFFFILLLFPKIKWKIYNDVGFWFFFLNIMRILILPFCLNSPHSTFYLNSFLYGIIEFLCLISLVIK